MHNLDLVRDYLTRAKHRLEAVELLFKRNSYADVVRESQEVVELCLKAVLRHSLIEAPHLHDVGQILKDNRDKLPEVIRPHVAKLAKISHSLRRDRELSFYGSEDLTPGDFYGREDGEQALEAARFVYAHCQVIAKKPRS